MKLTIKDVYPLTKKSFGKKDGSKMFYTVDYLYRNDSNELVAVHCYVDVDTFNKIIPDVAIDKTGALIIHNPIACRGHFNYSNFMIDEIVEKE